MQACATGKHFKDATIVQRKSGKGQQEFLVVKMDDIVITGVTRTSAGGDPSAETVSLAFAKIALEYKTQKSDGSLDAGIFFKFDVKAGKTF